MLHIPFKTSYLLSLFIIILFSTAKIYPQTIKSEKVVGNVYEVILTFVHPPFFIEETDGLNRINFPDFIDESKPGEFKLPVKDLFIPIPPGSKPDVELRITEFENISAIPELNPEVKILPDGTLSYKSPQLVREYKQSLSYEVKGFLWIEKNYCIHIKVQQVEFDLMNRITRINKNLNIRLIFENNVSISDENLKQKEKHSTLLNNIFLNQFNYTPAYTISSDDFWIDYSKEYVKIGTAKDAVYRIYPSDLSSLGINLQNINPKTFRLISRGEEIPIYVDGEDNLSFDPGDYIEFAGERNMGGKHREISGFGDPYNEYLDRYSDTTVYWLTWGSEDGMRVHTSDGTGPFTTDTLYYYNEIIHREVDNYFDFSMADLIRRESPFWYENKTWVDGQLHVGTLTLNFQLSDIYPDKPAKFFYKLQSFASNITNNAHLLGLSINSDPQVYDSGYINKYEKKVLMAEVNSNLLLPGSNNLRVHSYPTQASINACATDWGEVEYPRYLRAINDSLNFRFPFLKTNSLRVINISNLNTGSVVIWKYGSSYKRYEISQINNEIFLTDTINSDDHFVLIDPQKVSSPKLYYKKEFKNLRDNSNVADYIAVTNKIFLDQGQQYVEFIENEYNLLTRLIDIDDIYDEFAYGFFNPEAIRDFLMASHNYWQSPKPSYVCLIGSATYDYYGNKTKYFGAPVVHNYVPSFGSPVSDNWFVTWDTTGAYVPQLNVGRLPFSTNEEFDNYFQKHISYQDDDFDDWNKRYLFFSGGRGDNQSEIDLLKAANQFVIDNYVIPPPIGGLYHHFYKTINPNTNFGPYSPEEIQSAIDNGALFISYIGHSGTQTWDNSITDPFQLSNSRNRYSLITDFGCSTAKFAEPDVLSFSQTFINTDRGQAISYIGNSSLGFTSTAVTFPRLFYNKVLADSTYTISEALKLAKIDLIQNFGSTNVNTLFTLTNTLIGDPVVTLPIPPKPDLIITNSDITASPQNPTEDADSLYIKAVFYNYGKVISDTISIYIEDRIQQVENYSAVIVKELPSFKDSILFSIPILNKPGRHILTITLDSENRIDELNETNNSVQFEYNVSSSSIKPYLSYFDENALDSVIYFLNPSIKPVQEVIEIQLSDNKDFTGGTTSEIAFDSLYTKVDINNLVYNKRYWIRYRLKGSSEFDDIRSFKLFNDASFILNDSTGFSNGIRENVTISNNKILLDTIDIVFEVLSAGFNDGSSAVISKNSQNFIPENTLRGHHICLFTDSTYEFAGYRLFDLLGDPNATDNYMNFLDSLDNSLLVMIAISDEGRVTSQPLREKLKEFGSVYIDSVLFRSSWAIIGKKGAIPGTVPEGYSNPFEGRVIIDSSLFSIADTGFYSTIKIGPSSKWIGAQINKIENSNSIIEHLIIGTDINGTQDSLGFFTPENNIDLRMIDSKQYPYLAIASRFISSTDDISPELHSLAVDYITPPELGINYQVVALSKDSIVVGEDINLQFYVYNTGETSADSFTVKVELILPDNSRELISETFIDSLSSESRKFFNINYNVLSAAGNRFFNIEIDPENKILELYKDNNFFTIPFYVKPDTSIPSVNITFDGVDILDGDYISTNPEIKIELNDPSLLPVNDTSAVSLFLNDNPVYFALNPQILSYEFNSENPKMIVTYKPELSTGEYRLKVFGKNALGNLADSSGIEKHFLVDEETKMFDVYNYPNPFSNETYFTFRLTQIPDEMRIRIYTVAGRLVREIKKTFAELNFDFNRIHWDGRDEDGDIIANGVYFYKVILSKDGITQEVTQKLAVVR